jgi:hypothetical protein
VALIEAKTVKNTKNERCYKPVSVDDKPVSVDDKPVSVYDKPVSVVD